MLRLLLGSGDDALLSHSMKCTALSWPAKCGVPRELRRLLGRHATATRGSDSVYSRDLMITPVGVGKSHQDDSRWSIQT